MKPIRFSSIFFLLLILILAAVSCDQIPAGDSEVQGTTGLIQTILPATLTAISAAREPSQTPAPDPMGIPWSSVNQIELDFWYVWDFDEPGEGMNAIVDQFNLENEWGITVKAVDQGLVLDPLESINAAFEEGLVPDVMIIDSSEIAEWYQAGLTADLSVYIDDPAAGLTRKEQDDYYPGIFESFMLDGSIRPGLPFTQTIQVIFYNQSWAYELDIPAPPMTSEQLFDQSCAAANRDFLENSKDKTTGILLSPDAPNIISLIHAYDGSLWNQETDGYQFSTPEIQLMARDWPELSLEDCGLIISQYPDPMAGELEVERFNQRGALMMMGSSQMMGHIQTGANATGRPDDWLMVPFVGPEGKKSVSAEVQSVVVFKTSPEVELAAWMFLKYLISPEVQAEWVQYSTYYPTRKDSLRLLREYRAENPHWSQGLNLLKYAQTIPLDPSWNIVQLAVGDAFEDILIGIVPNLEEHLAVLDQIALELREYTRSEN